MRAEGRRRVRERSNWIWEESDVPNTPDLCTEFTRAQWMCRPVSTSASSLSADSTNAGPGIEAEQV